jgi:hypothetical protein
MSTARRSLEEHLQGLIGMDIDRALAVARWLSVDNPERIFHLAKSKA